MSDNLDQRIIPINIEDEMKTAYIDYSMSVIVSRALPDVRDGLKPVHRRVLYGMTELGLAPNRPYKKSARIVGEVLGKYHPHGDSSVYDTMVRMAQSWSLRYPMVDGQGNYGSIDGDPPAAMRYTEARLRKLAEEMLADINKNTVDYRPNFDESLTEPSVLPAKIPNLLVNGASGIAVGMATNMAPHNLTEVIDGTVAYIDNNDIEIAELMEHVKGPDFPTGGTIHGYDGIKNAFETGKGRVVVRGNVDFETKPSGKEMIIIKEVPYQVNPSNLIVKAVDLVNEKVLDGISAVRDESGRQGMRIVFELKRDAIPNIVLNKLYKYTPLQSSFSVNNIALVNGRPELLNLKSMISHYVDHRHEVLVRKTKYELAEAEKRAHILEGLIIAIDNLDEVIKLIRGSKTVDEAKTGLITSFSLSEIQAKAILDLRLQKLTGLERDKLKAEYQELQDTIAYLNRILDEQDLRYSLIKEDLLEMKEKYGDERRTQIEPAADDINILDLIPDEDVVITISHMGYIKRTPLAEYREQRRGGRGMKGVAHRDEDFTEHLFVATTHQYLLLFTEQGRCYWLRVYEVPESGKGTKGRAIQNLLNMPKDDNVKAFIRTKDLKDEEYINSNFILMCTKKGTVKKTSLEAYSRPRTNGINAITIKDGDELVEARITNGKCEVVMAKKSGKAIRFNEEKVRSMGRNASGVRGVRLESETDEVIGVVIIDPESDQDESILVVSEKGYGKRTLIDDYRITGRGGKGVKTLNITEKTGNLVGIRSVTDEDGLMIINKSGITIRMSVENLRLMGRATQGVKLINIKGEDSIASIAKVPRDDEDEEGIDGLENTGAEEASNADDAPKNENTDSSDENTNNEDE